MTKEQIKKCKKDIDGMTQLEMARLLKFAPIGSVYFSLENPKIVKYFKRRFNFLGGMTTAISKELG